MLYLHPLDPSSVFVFHAPQYTIIELPKLLFERMLLRNQLNQDTIRLLWQRNGQLVYYLAEARGLSSQCSGDGAFIASSP